MPPALGTLSGVCGGLLALLAVLLYPQVWPGLWISLLAVASYLVSLHLQQRWFRLLAPAIWAGLLLLLGIRAWLGVSAAEPAQAVARHLEIVHLLLWLAATTAVWLATMQAALLLRHHRYIKRDLELPADAQLPLEDMSRILTALAAASLVLMTLALGYSHWWGQMGAAPVSLLKYALAIGAWLLLAGLLASYWFFGLRGYRTLGWMFAALGTLALSLAWSFSFG